MSVQRYGFYCQTSDFLLGASLITEENDDGDYVLHSGFATLLALHNALVEAMAWERECDDMSFSDIWFDEFGRSEAQANHALKELGATLDAARAEVDRLLENPPSRG